MNLIFRPEIHKYEIIEHPEIELVSVSKLIELVKPPFDKEYWLEKKSKERGITKEQLEQEWDTIKKNSLERGTKYHNEFEQKLLKDKKTHPPSYEGEFKKAHDLKSLEVGVHPELILYSLLYGVVGTADIVEILPNREFIIRDHKSNKKLEFKGFMKFDPKYKERRECKMLSPLSHISDCNGLHYTIQLSLYAFLLEQFGYKCKELIINHVIFEGDEPVNIIEYPIQYLKREVQNLLNWYKTKNV